MFSKISMIIGTMTTTMAAGAALSVASFTPASAFPLAVALDSGARPQVTLVAEGCGYGSWRGPWGHCRHTAYFGNLPGGGYSAQPDCPSGYWVGPWGHCRDTPYHGRLPGGDYR